MMSDRFGNAIWGRGGRVEKLGEKLNTESTPADALREAASKLVAAAEVLEERADRNQVDAHEKRQQARELQAAADKLDDL